MATVHRAQDVLLGRQVAIKFLAPNIAASPAHLERFGREARAMAAIVHPNLVAIYDVGWADEQAGRTPYLVMELVTGGTLAQRLSDEGPLDPPSATALVEGLASALDALHKAGIVHRDVKPQNVLLSPTGPKLADLGIVRLDDPSEPDAAALTASGATPGTLRFLAPEVIFGQPAGPKADAYALAMVAFEALTGRSPRPAMTLGELVHGEWQPPILVSEAMPTLGTAFDAAFTAGLDLDPSRRLDVQSFAAAVWEALTAWAAAPGPPAAATAATEAAVPIESLATALDAEPTDLVAAAATVVDAASAPIAEDATAQDASAAGATAEGATAAAIAGPPALEGVARPNPMAFRPDPVTLAPRPPSPAPSRDTTDSTVTDLGTDVLRRLGALALVVGIVVIGLLVLRSWVGPGVQPPSASPSITVPVPSPSPTLSDDPGAAAREALQAVIVAIEAARGGPDGLKGGDANDLLALADDVERALADADYDEARRAAEELADRAEKVSDELDDDRSEALLEAIDALEAAIPPA